MKKTIIILLIGIALVTRLFALDWGSPYFFHPDERNIASSITQLRFPDNLNPHFFAYGSLPLYAIFLIGLLHNFLTSCHLSLPQCFVPFEQAILISRFLSSILSLLLLLLIYKTTQMLQNKSTGKIAVILSIFSVGLIQFSHFGTYEIWTSFFVMLLLFYCLHIITHTKRRYLFLSSIICGILCAIKISNLVFLPLFICINTYALMTLHKQSGFSFMIRFIRETLVITLITALVFFLTNPYVLLDTQSFLQSFQYESAVATGITSVFYTGEFFGTIPVIFQLIKVYPFLINPLLTLVMPFAFLFILFTGLRRKKITYILVCGFFFTTFFSQVFLFVKWSRYLVPTLPFIYIMIALTITDLAHTIRQPHKTMFLRYVLVLCILTGGLFTLAYGKTVLFSKDSRVLASTWAAQHIPQLAPILSESYDLGVLPFNHYFPQINLFNFYEMDTGNISHYELTTRIQEHDYFLVSSQRLLGTRMQNAKKFPEGYAFYSQLQQQHAFIKIYETPCDIFCKILYMGNPLFSFEQTTSVFDHPIVQIYKKI